MEGQVGISSANDVEAFNLQVFQGMGWEIWDRSKTGGHGVCMAGVDGRAIFIHAVGKLGNPEGQAENP